MAGQRITPPQGISNTAITGKWSDGNTLPWLSVIVSTKTAFHGARNRIQSIRPGRGLPVKPWNVSAVSYTHLTLPTIYSV